MVSNEEIKKKIQNKHETKISEGYLTCDKCGGYYELQPGESPEDFDSCECGGKLVYAENLDENGKKIPQKSKMVNTKFCLNCGTEINEKSKTCPECGVIQPINGDNQVNKNKKPLYKKKSPGLAVIYSILILGVGQVYNGQKLKGLLIFLAGVTLALLGLGVLTLIILLYAVIDAYNTAKKINKKLEEEYGDIEN